MGQGHIPAPFYFTLLSFCVVYLRKIPWLKIFALHDIIKMKIKINTNSEQGGL